MQYTKIFMLSTLLFSSLTNYAQLGTDNVYKNKSFGYKGKPITIQPGIGMRFKFGKDIMLSNLMIANPRKHFSVAAHTSFSYNNLFHRNFNYIKTNYDYSISQTLGFGTTLFSKRTTHSFLIMAGLKYNNFKQTLENPEFEKVSAAVSAINPDLGFRYNFTYGIKKYFFHTGLYIPLYPYPVKTTNIEAMDGNLKNISFEVGLGVRL